MKKYLCPECVVENSSDVSNCSVCGAIISLKDRYKLLKILGENIGITYLGEDLLNEKMVVIKELSLRAIDKWKVEEMFNREAKVLSQLNHPAIPKYIDNFSFGSGRNSRIYIVMEEIKGINLEKERESKKYSTKEILETIKSIAKILEYIHSLHPPIIHRDIKPSNIIRALNGDISLIDFGSVSDIIKQNGGSTIAGTFGYMAPEQFLGVSVKESDFYSLGVIAITLFSGKSPELMYDGVDFSWKKHISVKTEILDFLNKLTYKEYAHRFHYANEIIKEIDSILVLTEDTQDSSETNSQKNDTTDITKENSFNNKEINTNKKSDNNRVSLIKLAKVNDWEAIIYAIDDGAFINETGSFNENTLHYAINYADINIIRYLLDSNIDINNQNIYKQTPIIFALKEKKLDIVKLLIDRGANLTLTDLDGKNLLMLSAELSFEEIFFYIVDKIDIKIAFKLKDNSGDSTIFHAYKGKNLNIIDSLLNSGEIDIDERDSIGETLLIKSAREGNETVFDKLIKLSPDIEIMDKEHETALFNAIKHNNYNIFKKLVSLGANINTQDETGWTPLMRAIKEQNIDIVNYILENDGDINIKNNFSLSSIEIANYIGDIKIIDLLKNCNYLAEFKF